MGRALAYAVVFGAAATPWLEVLLVVPAGVLGGLAVVPTVLVATAGNVATLVPVVLAGERLRTWWVGRRVHAAAPPRGRRARHVMDRYGVAGLAVLGPLLTGAHVAALVAVTAGASRRRVLCWLSAGVTAWAILAAALAVAGLELLIDHESLPTIEAG